LFDLIYFNLYYPLRGTLLQYKHKQKTTTQ